MGRIVHNGDILLDIEDTMEILEKSRSTVSRLIKSNTLQGVRVKGSKKVWFLLPDVEGIAKVQVVPDEPKHFALLRKWHPEIFTECH